MKNNKLIKKLGTRYNLIGSNIVTLNFFLFLIGEGVVLVLIPAPDLTEWTYPDEK